MNSTTLAQISAARRALAEAKTFGDILRIRDVARAAEMFMRTARDSRDAWLEASEVRVLAERKAGELLKATPKRTGGAVEREQLSHGAIVAPPSLDDLGVTKDESSRWQKLADVPEPVVTEYVAQEKAKHGEITATGVLRAAANANPPAPAVTPRMPDGRYRCIVVDPPWPMQKFIDRKVRPHQASRLSYPTMPLDEIAALDIGALADDAAHLYLWVTHRFLRDGLRLVTEWGFEYQCLMTWVKPVGFTPYNWMYDTEHVLFAKRGGLALSRLGMRLSFSAPVTRHSAKPDVFYERVAEASPGPRLDMFARIEREGFAAWGNEVLAS